MEIKKIKTKTLEPLKQDYTDHDEKESKEPLYSVILYNDDINLYEHVIKAVQNAIHCSAEVAEYITHKAHTTGRAKVTSGDLDYAKQVYGVLISRKLTSEIQKEN